ncbi:MAG TPA: CocE/NonD family hydrolase [Geminicoccaceae bacterium]
MAHEFKTVTDFPHRVREIEHFWIRMPDGCRLAARAWMPEDAETHPVPAILEYIPYRKRDSTAPRDAINHPYFAGHGYACVRVDLRGSGESEGLLLDEYLEQELVDGVEVIRWLAGQPWCSGAVGMIGISWGGFNGLQIAARRPEALQAVVTICSTDDRYADDVHYMGGCLLGDNLSWASTMFAYNSCPPDPALVGERWRAMWLERLQHNRPWLEPWLHHQHRDAYWRHGSICEDFSAVQCPVLAASGWADGYSNAVFRLLAGLEVPRAGLIGPWSHKYPHLGVPGPAIGFLQECLRWWDQWLKGIDRGVMEEPMLRAWMQDSVSPWTTYDERPGRWVGEPSWPSPNIEDRLLPLAEHRIAAPGEPVEETAVTIQSPLSVGLFAGKWCSYAGAPDLPHDQREEDGGALVFDGDRLGEPLEILGSPTVEFELAADQPVAMIAVRLSDVMPDHKVTRITYGLLNLTHRDGHEHPEPLEPGRFYRVRVKLNDIAHSFPAGHRLRLAVSTSYFPLAWPPPRPARLTIRMGTSVLRLPVRAPRASDRTISVAEQPEGAKPLAKTPVAPERHSWRVIRDLGTDESVLEVVDDRGAHRLDDIDLTVRTEALERYSYVADDFDSARGETRWVREFSRGPWSVRTVTRTVLTADADTVRVRAELDAYEGDTRVFANSWDLRIPRRLV